jgi:seryl-tRNA synthetase
MLYIPYVRENKDAVIKGLQKKRFPKASETVEQLLLLDQRRRDTQTQLDSTLAQSNGLAKEIGALMKLGKKEEAEAAKNQTATLKTQARELEEGMRSIEEELQRLLVTIPNVPHPSVPEGRTAEDNEVVMQHGDIPQLYAGAVPHWDLIKKYDIIDFELGTKISGAGFPVYKGKGARLQRAMINFFLDEALAAGYSEIQPPIVVNEASGFGTGQLPDKEGQMYFVKEDNLYLIPTAEVPITNIYRDVILEAKELPVKNVGYTPCFRREAGSWGAHVRGLNRLHQFDKVEIVRIETPERSYTALEEMVQHVRSLLEKLQLPYRLLKICGGDMSFTAALGYDLEVYSAAQGRWLEVSSVSNFESYQANRLKLRYRDENKKMALLHTLNGSALALPRILAALLENNQSENGIAIPEVLRPYTGFDRIG